MLTYIKTWLSVLWYSVTGIKTNYTRTNNYKQRRKDTMSMYRDINSKHQ